MQPDGMKPGLKIPTKKNQETQQPNLYEVRWALNTTLRNIKPADWGKEFFRAAVLDQPLKNPAAQQYANTIMRESLRLGGFTDTILEELPGELKTPDLEVKMRSIENEYIDLLTQEIERTGNINPNRIAEQDIEFQFEPAQPTEAIPTPTRTTTPTSGNAKPLAGIDLTPNINDTMNLYNRVQQGQLAITPNGDFYTIQQFYRSVPPTQIDLQIDTSPTLPPTVQKLKPPNDPATYIVLSEWGNMHISMRNLNENQIKSIEQSYKSRQNDPDIKKMSLFGYYVNYYAQPISGDQIKNIIREQWRTATNSSFVRFIRERSSQKPVWIRLINDPFQDNETMGTVVVSLTNLQKEALQNARKLNKSPIRWQAVKTPIPNSQSAIYLLVPTFLQENGTYKPYYIEFKGKNPFLYHFQFDSVGQVSSAANMILFNNRWITPANIGIKGQNLKKDIEALVKYLNSNDVMIGPHWIKSV